MTDREALIDILVHGLDIAIPLDVNLHIPPDVATAAVPRTWTMRFPPPFPTTKTTKGFHVTATDADWSAGTGPQIDGPIDDSSLA